MNVNNSRLAALIQTLIAKLEGKKTLPQIATELGYDKPKMILMFASGEARVPFNKVDALVRALNADARFMWQLAFEQYGMQSVFESIDRVLQGDEPPTVLHTTAAADDTASGLQDMNFKVPPEFHRRFRMEAARRGLSMKRLLEVIIEEYMKNRFG
jgi:hypothetical protein